MPNDDWRSLALNASSSMKRQDTSSTLEDEPCASTSLFHYTAHLDFRPSVFAPNTRFSLVITPVDDDIHQMSRLPSVRGGKALVETTILPLSSPNTLVARPSFQSPLRERRIASFGIKEELRDDVSRVPPSMQLPRTPPTESLVIQSPLLRMPGAYVESEWGSPMNNSTLSLAVVEEPLRLETEVLENTPKREAENSSPSKSGTRLSLLH